MLFFRLNIYAVVIANAFFAFLVCVLNAMELQRHAGYKQEFQKTFLIPALSSLGMGVIAYGVYALCFLVSKNNLVSIIVSILFAVVVYAVALLLLKGLTEEEIRKFPKGYLLVQVAKTLRLLK